VEVAAAATTAVKELKEGLGRRAVSVCRCAAGDGDDLDLNLNSTLTLERTVLVLPRSLMGSVRTP